MDEQKDILESHGPAPEISRNIHMLLNGLLGNRDFSVPTLTPQEIKALPDIEQQVYMRIRDAKANFGKPEVVMPLRAQITSLLEGQFRFASTQESLKVLKKFILPPAAR